MICLAATLARLLAGACAVCVALRGARRTGIKGPRARVVCNLGPGQPELPCPPRSHHAMLKFIAANLEGLEEGGGLGVHTGMSHPRTAHQHT